ncbi:MAG: histidine phosphatase family protein [Myxococcota bacterium]|nr:histidine phosphatase family protein [Deltaproteobacteria bacterium]MDQ3335889.1 histidine phosphatase family protein [Myxococcota bacterium]
MRILLVRHGESMGNVDPTVHATTADHAVPLSELGHDQAREAGRHIARYFETTAPDEKRHVRLWLSPYRRTRETADALYETAGVWVTDRVEHILLCEQQFGLFDGLTDAQMRERFPHEKSYFDLQCRFGGKFWARMPQGESRFDVAQRIHQAFGTFQRDAVQHGIRDIVVICHGVTLRAFVMMWCHLSPEWFESEPNPANCAVRLIDHGRDRGYLFAGFPRS